MKVIAFLNNIVPYHHARWDSTAPFFSRCLVVEITNRDEFKTLEFEQASNGSYERMTLFPSINLTEISNKRLAKEIRLMLMQEKPDVVFVSGYSFFYNWVALEWGLCHGIPIVVCSESNEHDDSRIGWKEAVKRFFVSRCSAGLAGGTSQASYLKKLGVPQERLFTGYDVVDNEYFKRESIKVRNSEGETRKKLALPQRYFFACARFGKKKNIPSLISVYALFLEQFSGDDAPHLVIVGEGEELYAIEQRIAAHHLSARVHLVGPKSYNQLPSYYALAEVFIHASTTEQWGLVVNEAMASGLPLLVSNRCGCAIDLIQEGVNGWIFDPHDEEQLANLMAKISTDEDRRLKMGDKSREIISDWGPERFARGVADAVRSALSAPKQKHGFFDRLLLSLIMLK